MRRRTIFLAAGLSAYFIGASVRAHLLRPDGLPGCDDVVCRVAVVVEHPRAALRRPLKAIRYTVAPVSGE